MNKYLNHLNHNGQFTQVESQELMQNIMKGQYNNEQVAAFLMGLNGRPWVVDEIIGFRKALLEASHQLPFKDYETIDIVGTGGDGKNTFNISTTTALVVAAAGYKVAKHGSYAVSSISGSADVLLQLGIRFTNEEDKLRDCIEETNFVFLHAPLFHPAMKHVVPIRKALGIKTVFNILGPLINPSGSTYALIGVYQPQLIDLYKEVLDDSSISSFEIVHSHDGYDEISMTGSFVSQNKTDQREFEPKHFGLSPIHPDQLFGGDTKSDAATILKSILENQATPEQKDVVLANAAFAIQTIKPNLSLLEAKQEANEAIESGKTKKLLQKLIEITSKYE